MIASDSREGRVVNDNSVSALTREGEAAMAELAGKKSLMEKH
jgi:hypothetical protein